MSTNCYPTTADWRCVPDGMTLDPEIKEQAEMLAWATLRVLTGFQTGNCPVTVRPCARRCGYAGTWFVAPVAQSGFAGVLQNGTFAPRVVDGMWINSCGCGQNDLCSCTTVSAIRLPGPIGEVTDVKIDGVTLAPTAYAVYGDQLVRVDGESWPLCQDILSDDSAQGTFAVTYRQGYPIDEIVNIAAGTLALELYYACRGESCRLPANATAVTRQGLTIELAGSLFVQGWTGIPEVDVVIGLLNPHGLKVAPQVWSPDGPRLPGNRR